MKRFIISGWFTAVASILLAVTTYGSLVWLDPKPETITSPAIANVSMHLGFGTVGAAFVLTLLLTGLLKLCSRIIRLRQSVLIQWLISALTVSTWIAFSWVLTGEPRYTPIAEAIIDFIARPLLLGSLITMIMLLIMLPFAVLPERKK